jgi:NADPH:quinone reductase-like Zn-dependent oxidoreductase
MERSLRAFSYSRFGDASVLHLADVPEPAVGDAEVVVAIEARSINLIDIRVRSGTLGPLVSKRFPKVPGADFAGTVAAVGGSVKGLHVGDRVFGAADPFKGGAFAERIAVPAMQVTRLPSALSPSDGAALPIAGLAALQSLRDLGSIKSGQTTVLIHGATGPVGLYSVQLAKLMGGRITAIGGAGLDTARRLGADVLIDYRDGQSIAKGERFDIILNASGRMPYAIGKSVLTPGGRLIEPSPTIPVFIGSKLGNLFRSRKHMVLATQVRRADLDYLARLAGEGTLKPVIAATFPFNDALQAFGLVERGGVIGKVVVTQ